MRTECLNYYLPRELIAQRPSEVRSGSRLLLMERATGSVTDRRFGDITAYVGRGDCLVLNNTKVLAARFFARRKTGAKLEGLFLNETETGLWEVMLKNAGKVREGENIILCARDSGCWGQAKAVRSIGDGRWQLEVDNGKNADEVLAEIGFAPLPPYIKRKGGDGAVAESDLERYQTVYAQQAGAVAAPTAGLHFTNELLGRLTKAGVKIAYVTLHVGIGTFRPVTAENLAQHRMHSERFSLSETDAETINSTISAGRRIVAVGTTSVRTLETVAKGRSVEAGEGATELFIQPGYEFQIVDAMVTNFHLPKSTLLAMVGAFAGLEKVLAAYRHAIEQRYRFYSYGDAMMIF
jgi:S-adenosylmethionine:tRNA ribosyltransferase-isomerase